MGETPMIRSDYRRTRHPARFGSGPAEFQQRALAMTSFANIPPPKIVARKSGVMNGACWGVLAMSTLWNVIWIFVGTVLHFNRWLASSRNFTLGAVGVSTVMVLLGIIVAGVALDVLSHKSRKWLAWAALWTWMMPSCLGIGIIAIGWPRPIVFAAAIVGGWLIALVVRLNSPILRSRESPIVRTIGPDYFPADTKK
jgi:hypothetical protein